MAAIMDASDAGAKIINVSLGDAAVVAWNQIPAYADCVRGRKMATVTKCRFDLEVCGGTFVNEPCVIDGNLVSGRTFHDNGHYVGPWIRLLEEYAAKVGI